MKEKKTQNSLCSEDQPSFNIKMFDSGNHNKVSLHYFVTSFQHAHQACRSGLGEKREKYHCYCYC